MNTQFETVNASDLRLGDVISYHGHVGTLTSEKQAAPNQFGLPWFRFKFENDHGWGWAQFGPTGTALRKTQA